MSTVSCQDNLTLTEIRTCPNGLSILGLDSHRECINLSENVFNHLKEQFCNVFSGASNTAKAGLDQAGKFCCTQHELVA